MNDAANEIRDLLTEGEQALSRSERTRDLVAQLPRADDTSPLRIAFAGPTNAGKSLLIGLLAGLSKTDLNARVSALPETSDLHEDVWRSHTLLDMPGTMSGLLEHEVVAAEGVRKADLLVLVTTVELPGKQETSSIRRLLLQEGSLHRCLVVVNKINLENNARDVIEAELRGRLGDATTVVPVVFVDAGDRRQALHGEGFTEADRQLLNHESGFSELEEHLATLVEARAAGARSGAHRREILRLLSEAQRRWEVTDAEAVQDTAAARYTSSLSRAQTDLQAVAEHAASALHYRVTAIGAFVADAVQENDGSIAESALEAAQARYDKTMADFEHEVTQRAEPILQRLSLDLESGHRHDRQRLSEFHTQRPAVDASGVAAGPFDEAAGRIIDKTTTKVGERLKAFTAAGTREGAPAHALGRKINQVLQVKPRRNVHINRAEQLTKAAKGLHLAAEVAGPALDLKKVYDNRSRLAKIDGKRTSIRSDYEDLARELAEEARANVDELVTQQLAPYRELIAPVLQEVSSRQEQRQEALERISSLVARAARAPYPR